MNGDQTGKKQSDIKKKEDEEEEDVAFHRMFFRLMLHRMVQNLLVEPLLSPLGQMLVKLAVEKCTNKTVLKWLTDDLEPEDLSNLAKFFHFFKERIDVEEKKNHDNGVDIIFMAHGAIKDVMTPACRLLPLSSITDVVLYSPWNCATSADVSYALATGRLRPSHRVFKKDNNCTTAAPVNLPNRWNSMKELGEKMIPNISVSPLLSIDGVWRRYESLREKHGSPGRNRIMIPFKFPDVTVGTVPFSVVSLALSLVLQSSRFTATVHLDICLTDQSKGQKFDPEYLRSQYAYTPDNTVMTVSPDMFTDSLIDRFRRWLE